MLKQNLNTSEVRADQVASPKPQALKLGLDVHADTIVVVRLLDHSAPQPAQKFTPAKFLTWIKTQLHLAVRVHSCYEAGPFGYGLHRDLVALVHNLVVQPVCLDEQHKGVNHDKREVQRLAAQGRGLLLTQSWREKKGWWTQRRWTQLQPKLPAWLIPRLECFRRVLSTLTSELDRATTALEAAAPAVRPKGLGGLSYEVVEREVGDWQRFSNRRQVGSYTGLCGGVSASGKSTHLLP